MANESKPSLHFGKARRLTRPAEFARVKSDGAVQRGSFILLGILQLPADEPGDFRAGFITSKRIGGAVVRNRVRRRLREIVRRHQHEILPHLCLVLIAKTTAARAEFAALEDEYLRLARRASILAP